MKLSEGIKIREEEGFYLLINVNSESILKGYPSFFKINDGGHRVIKEIQSEEFKDKIQLVDKLKEELSWSEQSIRDFIQFLYKVGICYD